MLRRGDAPYRCSEHAADVGDRKAEDDEVEYRACKNGLVIFLMRYVKGIMPSRYIVCIRCGTRYPPTGKHPQASVASYDERTNQIQTAPTESLVPVEQSEEYHHFISPT